ncbi:MAG: DUF559 domain-containing protein [Anaerolineales bacterium]|nr:DUF559 domain-containing protein [Anaerolineales bacterium]
MDDKHNKFLPKITKHRARTLRKEQTKAEEILWFVLRNRNLCGWKFRRQHPIGPFIVDFFCLEAKLVVEVDGDTHVGQEEYDERRTEWLNGQGYRVIRFTNREVLKHTRLVMEVIWEACQGWA